MKENQGHQHGIASKQAQIPKTNISNSKSAMLVGCCYKDEVKHEPREVRLFDEKHPIAKANVHD